MPHFIRVSFAAAIAAGLVSCAAAPEPKHEPAASVDAAMQNHGEVRWGGIVAGRRSTDAGSCVEIATLEISPTTGAPLARSFPDLLWPSTMLDRRGKSAPRFLACGVDEVIDVAPPRFGALLTVTGKFERTLNFSVDRASCLQPAPGGLILPSRPDYSGTSHTFTQDTCNLALPVVEVSSVKTWRDAGTSRLIHPGDYYEDLSMHPSLH